jgi:hypothetical protein
MQNETRVKSKPKPIFKPIDMWDVYNSLSYILGTAVELSYKNNATSVISTCPITPQQVHVLLRVIVSAIRYKTFGQGYSYVGASNTTFIPMTFSAINENMSSSIRTILLPLAFVENLRGLAVSIVNLGRASGASKDKQKFLKDQLLVFAPVFGYLGQTQQPYNFTLDTPGNLPLYTPPPVSEETISLPDFTDILTNVPLAVSGLTLNAIIQQWNDWIQPLSNYMQTSTMDSEHGASALSCLTMTRYCSLTEEESQQQKTKPKTLSKNLKTKFELPENLKVVKLSVVPDAPGLSVVAYSANQPTADSVYTEFHARWILPKVLVDQRDAASIRLCINNWQVCFCEPYRILSSGVSLADNTAPVAYPDINDGFKTFAQQVSTMTFNNKMTTVQLTLDKLQKEGSGGYIGQAIADFAAVTLGMPFLSQLGSLLPF